MVVIYVFFYAIFIIMCKNNPKTLRTINSWAYIAGLIETDGSLSLRLDKKGYFFATVSITQKNQNLLKLCQLFFKKYQLNASFDYPKKELILKKKNDSGAFYSNSRYTAGLEVTNLSSKKY